MSTTLEQLAAQCAACRGCPHGETRTQTVFAKGDPLSPLCFVGEAPGEEEDAQGLPFVGSSGQFLDRQIAAMREYAAAQGIAFPANPYVCNVLKCRPPGNKLLKDGSDIAACCEHLWVQLRTLPNLRVIVALGRVAAHALVPKFNRVGYGFTMAEMRAWTIVEQFDTACVFPTYHPAYLLRRRNDTALHAEAWADLKCAVEGLR